MSCIALRADGADPAQHDHPHQEGAGVLDLLRQPAGRAHPGAFPPLVPWCALGTINVWACCHVRWCMSRCSWVLASSPGPSCGEGSCEVNRDSVCLGQPGRPAWPWRTDTPCMRISSKAQCAQTALPPSGSHPRLPPSRPRRCLRASAAARATTTCWASSS